jgi:hypothetical protein
VRDQVGIELALDEQGAAPVVEPPPATVFHALESLQFIVAFWA